MKRELSNLKYLITTIENYKSAVGWVSAANEVIFSAAITGAQLRRFSHCITSNWNLFLHLQRILQSVYSRPSRHLSFRIWYSSMSCGVIQNRLLVELESTEHPRPRLQIICYYCVASNASLRIFLVISKLITCTEIYHWVSPRITQIESSFCGNFLQWQQLSCLSLMSYPETATIRSTYNILMLLQLMLLQMLIHEYYIKLLYTKYNCGM